MIVVQRPFVDAIDYNDRRFSYGFYIISNEDTEYVLDSELNIIKSKLIKDTDDRPISNQGQDIR